MEKDKVMKCYDVIQDMRLVEMRSSLVSKAPQTLVGVLDVTCLSYTSAETMACLGRFFCIEDILKRKPWMKLYKEEEPRITDNALLLVYI
ncbi:hypothetical protein HPP92_028568 [Vanilla planifolia]|uniref:Uncharacterized protein n=1 Tax=Vanilla planifolia TaxID=51239 RepID=A0A835P5I1_VANPL|nr:hypothetical protein HPP92_028568 [Vanilla planifolia]